MRCAVPVRETNSKKQSKRSVPLCLFCRYAKRPRFAPFLKRQSKPGIPFCLLKPNSILCNLCNLWLEFLRLWFTMRTNTLVILTPEGIRFTQHLAGPVTRFLAFAIDLAGITLISGIFSQFLSLAAVVNADFVLAARTV